MSIDGVPSTSARALDRADDEDLPQPSRDEGPALASREFDFAGGSYSTVHLPSALIRASAGARPTAAAVMKDLADFEGKMRRLETDLASPGMRTWLAKHVEATKTGVHIGVKLVAVGAVVALFQEKGIALAASTSGVLRIITCGANIAALVDDCKTFARQLSEEHAAAKAAHPDVVRIEHDLLDLMSAGAKLAVDLRKLGGA